ncbi:MAG TPA: AraC family transcriptional regulator [Chitinophaga sp.]|uniref:AraC family transcriptional regulator n=1 Tax=Chitinophaga sp. TaxID=1869181 RepID=UPI002C68CDC1|nr:AraC family transcriptional regulator [Chitinophaga sp.]HVI44981.1 AraC family transcriptional regulator [Chitinophaga sp.]
MQKINIHQPVEVIYEKVNECPLSRKELTFFQIVYIISGTGSVEINGNRLAYGPENLLLFTPGDHQYMDIGTTSEILLIRFNCKYISEHRWKTIAQLETLLEHASHVSGCIMRNREDSVLVRSIVSSILHGIRQPGLYHEDLTMHFINALIVVAARNISGMKPTGLKVNADKRMLEIINYIQSNIHCPHKLKASAIGEAFGISETYLGSYFKNQCGETIQHFIAVCRIRLIEYRLKYSDMRINEIALEFGFTDESHLNKFFKKHRQQSLTGYRKAETVYIA